MRTGGMTMPSSIGDLAAQRAHPVEQVAAALGVDQVDQVGGEHELERVDAHLGGEQPRGCPGTGPARLDRRGVAAASASVAGQPLRDDATASAPPTSRNGSLGRPGIRQRTSARARRRSAAASAVGAELPDDVGAHVALGRRRG